MDFYVEAHEECGECKGAGVVEDHRWARYWREHPAGFIERDTFGDPGMWFMDTYNLSELPPEEIECKACKGVGVLVNKMRLEDALSLLAASEQK